jgi:integrase
MKARAPKDAVYVFPGDGDGPLLDIKTMWRGLMRRAEITGFRIHDLRHTFASRRFWPLRISRIDAILSEWQRG